MTQLNYLQICIFSTTLDTDLVSMSRETSFLLFITELRWPSHVAPSELGSINIGGRCQEVHRIAAFSICLGPKSANGIPEILHLSRVMRKSTFYICENKDADQLRGNREADQRLCFRYTDSTIPLLSKSEISSL